jgi:hypothetical protein
VPKDGRISLEQIGMGLACGSGGGERHRDAVTDMTAYCQPRTETTKYTRDNNREGAERTQSIKGCIDGLLRSHHLAGMAVAASVDTCTWATTNPLLPFRTGREKSNCGCTGLGAGAAAATTTVGAGAWENSSSGMGIALGVGAAAAGDGAAAGRAEEGRADDADAAAAGLGDELSRRGAGAASLGMGMDDAGGACM